MKKFGTMIIKPDAYNLRDLQIIKDILQKYNLYEDNLCFPFDNYPQVILEYRTKDVLFKNLTNVTSDLPDGLVRQAPEEELKYCKIALHAYEKFFAGEKAIALLLPTRGRDLDEFFDAMYQAKKEIRSTLRTLRNDCYAYVNYNTPEQDMQHLSLEEYTTLHDKDSTSVNRAHVDGIHLEDKECFLNNFCLSFMVSTGVIKKSNQLSLTKICNNLNW